MYGSKLLVMAQALEARELRRFVDYVHSPYFNKHERLNAFADYLYTAITERDPTAFNRQAVYTYLFPGEPFNEQRLADLMSYLTKLLEGFLAQERFEADAFQRSYYLLTDLGERNQDKFRDSTFRKLRKQQGKRAHRNETYLLHEYLVWDESDHYFMRQQQRTQDESLQHKVDALDLFYLTAKLKNACEMVNRAHVIAVDYKYILTEELLRYLDDHIEAYLDYPPIQVYYHILRTLKNPEEPVYYEELKKVLDTARPYFQEKSASQREQEEVRYMYLYVQNYCIHQVNRGRKHYLRELFELYKWLLESRILFEGEYLSQWDYKNIVSAGHRLEEYDWTEGFIHRYREHLAPEVRENAFNYNQAVLLYHQHDYRAAKRLLQEVQFTDAYYALGGRVLLLRIYFEVKDWEPLYSLLDSFQVFLKRNKQISTYQQEIHLNFLRLVRKLTRLRTQQEVDENSVTPEKVAALHQEIAQSREVAARQWLEQQTDALTRLVAQAV